MTAANHHASVRPHTLRPLSLHPRTNTPASHLLGKKSWNVYNPANIARVRRDEAAAQAREEADEQRMQEVDAARRLAILRGEIPPPLDDESPPDALPSRGHHDDRASRKRKRHGEDDTDFEMRVARERASGHPQPTPTNKPTPSSSSSAPLVDDRGHISLFSAPAQPREPNPDATRETARKDRELKDQYQMRLVNAAGRDGAGLTDGGPWYASGEGEVSAAAPGVTETNVWGRDDPARKDRAAARLGASDPLALMQRGARMVRELEKGRRREVEEREREMREMEREERRERRRERRREERRRSREREERRGEREGGRDDGAAGREARRDGDDDRRNDRRRDRSQEQRRDRSEDRRRDRSKDRHRRHRDGRDSPVRDGEPEKRERSHRDHGERHRDRSRERDQRRDDRHERHRYRDDHKYRHSDNSS